MSMGWEPSRGALKVMRALIARPDSTGVDIWRTAESMGWYGVGPGSVYPALATMEQNGLVEARMGLKIADRQRRHYTLTAAGERVVMSYPVPPVSHWDRICGWIAGGRRKAKEGT